MKIHWLVQAIKYQNDMNNPQRIVYVLQEQKQPYTCFEYIPFGGTDWSFLKYVKKGVFYGTLNALQDVEARVPDYPRPFAWTRNMDCSEYFEGFKDFILQEDYRFMRFGDLTTEVYTDSYKIFVKPNSNTKEFTGQVVEISRFKAWKELHEECGVSPNLLLMFCRAQNLLKEWRFLIVNGNVVTGSQYHDCHTLDISDKVPAKAILFAKRAAQSWSPEPVYMMDVAEKSDGQFKIVEIGPFNYAGLYMCDLRKVVKAISQYDI